jgi:hypothetical protein
VTRKGFLRLTLMRRRPRTPNTGHLTRCIEQKNVKG